MPIRLQSSRVADSADRTSELLESGPSEGSREPIKIGLVNNMPQAAFKATESQFVSLLESASEGLAVELSLYVLRGTAGTASVEENAGNRYAGVEELRDRRLDGLIITGTEPTTASLKDEPYWESFAQLVDWARENTRSTIWSCLAAHAAILHMDGIERRRNHAKHFGVLECEKVFDNWLLNDATARFRIPHSRWNGVAEKDLEAHGYRVLSRTAGGEVDAFLKQDKSLFVFFQGHPEYATDTLLREYRRDVGRYVRDSGEMYPLVPSGYFDRASEAALTSLRETASSLSSDQLLGGVAAVMETIAIENTWRPTAVCFYKNWLEYIGGRKEVQRSTRKVDADYAAFQ
jgi:homoserine O-succinyltransferase